MHFRTQKQSHSNGILSSKNSRKNPGLTIPGSSKSKTSSNGGIFGGRTGRRSNGGGVLGKSTHHRSSKKESILSAGASASHRRPSLGERISGAFHKIKGSVTGHPREKVGTGFSLLC